jgi:hypothetical protein
MRHHSSKGRSDLMKKITKAALAGGVAAAAIAIGAGVAHADASSFVSDLRDAGFSNPNGGNIALLNQGYWICGQLNLGATPSALSDTLYWTNDVSLDQSGQLVGIAVRELCPAHMGQGFYASWPIGKWAAA